mmetsp:Transcript_14202/g.38000  ORF Transcript_14202/g.38000 Transcript_14202/m.38000 type:complete len:161 (+) Transcript_14202:71-553(+)
MHAADVFYLTFFSIFLFVALNVDIYGLGVASWPIPPVKGIIKQYVEFMDPVFGTDDLWHRAIIFVEVTVYPFFLVPIIVALSRGTKHSPWVFVPSVIFATAITYSYVPIFAYNMFGRNPTPFPFLWCAAYLPFLVIPISFPIYVSKTIAARRKPNMKKSN